MAVQDQAQERKPKALHVRVVDHAKEGHPVVNITIPVRVVKFGMRMAKTFSPQMRGVDLDWDAISAMIEDDEVGKIVEVEDEAENKTVEVWVD